MEEDKIKFKIGENTFDVSNLVIHPEDIKGKVNHTYIDTDFKKEYCFDMEIKVMDKRFLDELLKPKPCEKCGNIPDFYLQDTISLEMWCNHCKK